MFTWIQITQQWDFHGFEISKIPESVDTFTFKVHTLNAETPCLQCSATQLEAQGMTDLANALSAGILPLQPLVNLLNPTRSWHNLKKK